MCSIIKKKKKKEVCYSGHLLLRLLLFYHNKTSLYYLQYMHSTFLYSFNYLGLVMLLLILWVVCCTGLNTDNIQQGTKSQEKCCPFGA